MADEKNPYGEPIKIFDFKSGLFTVRPEILLPDDASPYCRNIWYDELNSLTKMPGTQELINSENIKNQFAYNPPYNLFNYRTGSGNEKLIIQGPNSANDTMKIWTLDRQDSYPATVDPTDITPDSGLAFYRRCCFAVYRGYLYLANGANNLKRWDGSVWTECHADETEHFRYIWVYDDCLFGACSTPNPNRVVFTEQNECYWKDYYDNGTHWVDVPTTAGDRITWGSASPKGSSLIWKRDSIHELSGSPVNDTNSIRQISGDKGTIDGWSVQNLGDSTIFVWQDGFYAIGGVAVRYSQEDQDLKVEPSITPLSAEVRNWWADNVADTLPQPEMAADIKESGYSSFCQTLGFDTGTDASDFKADGVGLEKGDFITGGTSGATALIVHISLTSGTWGAGTALGTLYLTNVTGTFQEDEALKLGTVQYALATGANSGWTLTHCQVNRPYGTNIRVPDVINFNINPAYKNNEGLSKQTTIDLAWSALRSNLGENQYFSQRFSRLSSGGTNDFPIPTGGALYLKEIGNVSGQTLKVYVTYFDAQKPDFSQVYAEGTLDGNFLHGIEELKFDTGTSEIFIGETVQNHATSPTATGVVHKVVLTESSTWGGTGQGYLYIKGKTGTWADDDPIYISTVQHATVNTGATEDSSPISTGCWVFCEMTYWDRPQPLLTGSGTGPGLNAIAIKSEGDDDDNYMSWCYSDRVTMSFTEGGTYEPQVDDTITGQFYSSTAKIVSVSVTGGSWAGGDAVGTMVIDTITGEFLEGGFEKCNIGAETSVFLIGTITSAYTAGSMVNSDGDTPLAQIYLDYCFIYYGGYFYSSFVTVETTTIDAGINLDFWNNVYVILDEATIRDYVRNSELQKIDYEIKTADSGWDWGNSTETTNGGTLSGTGRYIRLRLWFGRPSGIQASKMDSFTMTSIRLAYSEESMSNYLIGSAIFENRYWFSTAIADPENPMNYCLDFDDANQANVEVEDSEGLSPGLNDYSIIFEMKFDKNDQAQQFVWIFVSEPDVPTDNKYIKIGACHDGGDYVQFVWGTTRVTSDPIDVMDNEWHTVVFSFDRDGYADAYVDGVRYLHVGISAASAVDVTTYNNIYIGKGKKLTGDYAWNYADGKIDNVHFYHRTISQAEAQWLHNSPGGSYDDTGLKFFLKMNEGAGITAYDSSDEGNNGKINSATWEEH